MSKFSFTGLCALAAVLFSASALRAETIQFISYPYPNGGITANTGAEGSTAEVSVGYGADTYTYGGYGTLDGTGLGAYGEDNSNDDAIVITLTAAPGYTVTLNSFDLANYDNLGYTADISVTGGSSAYSLTGQTPSGLTYTEYSPDVTGSSLTLTVANGYTYVGINDITFTSNLAPSATPEPASWVLMLTGLAGLVGVAWRTSRQRLLA